MAVEAHHLHLFPPQLITNREIVNAIETNANYYNNQMGFNVPFPSAQTLIPFYNSTIADSIPADSGLTCNLPAPRKNLREFNINNNNGNSNGNNPFLAISDQKECHAHPFSFLGEDLSLQIQQQQLEIDRFIAQHAAKVRNELVERRRQQSKRLIAAVEERMMKRLKAKEEEIDKIGKLNWALEERVKTLCMENQIWRDLAQTNEATAIALRTNLDQVMAMVRSDPGRETADDAESCCDSSSHDEERRRLAVPAQDKNGAQDKGEAGRMVRVCRSCGKGEACVLLLPCRHLCLCTACGTCVHTCPVCKSSNNGSVHVNMS
ncbi:probable BOI-related E3 ubiquitin-protein ligase 3 [Magnolia sinica]|uniref:probable BOI-related E3 ubiquitin-protein ligase 3 n=1 Tax=Magnolia sinica TaxID=86752 RepID=UPI0026599E9F|nr:probable BOI-related E3 ubiquitin-protein ligase 3 [Magnolia sinica]